MVEESRFHFPPDPSVMMDFSLFFCVLYTSCLYSSPMLLSCSLLVLNTHYFAINALPYTNSPVAASTLSPAGSGLPVLIALGIELPARRIDARSASSTP